MSSTPAPDFSQLAAVYDVLRPVDDNWWEVYGVVEQLADLRGRRVLDVGCGTGRLSVALAERAGAKVWGVDASPEMLAVARGEGPARRRVQGGAGRVAAVQGRLVRARRALARRPPRRPRAAFAEARRVLSPGGRVAVVTFDSSHFDAYWLNAYLPSLERIDRARFPDAGRARCELERGGLRRG